MKVCNKCGVEKPLTEFHKQSRNSDGHQGKCKDCVRLYSAEHYLLNTERIKLAVKQYKQDNPEVVAQRYADHYSKHRTRIRLQHQDYRVKNKVDIAAKKADDYQRNRSRHSLKSAEYYLRERKRLLESTKRYKVEHPLQLRAWYAQHYQENKSRYNVKSQLWRKENPNLCREYKHNRRARKYANGGTLSKGIVQRLFREQEGKCVCCSQPLGADFHLDHRIPLSRGGPNLDSNMQLLRATCNLQKAARHPVEFMRSRGHLNYKLPASEI